MKKKTILVTHQLPKEAFIEVISDYDVVMPDNGLIDNNMIDRWIGVCDALLPTYAFKVTKDIRWVLIIIFFEILIPPEPFMRDAPHFFYRKYNKNLL